MIPGVVIDRDWLRDVCNDDRKGFLLIHEGDDIIEYDDISTTLHVVEDERDGKHYGIMVVRQGNYEDPVWTYEFLGEYERREVTTFKWVEKK